MITRLFTAVLAGMFLSSCSSDPYPPILEAPTYSYRPGEFVWHELATTNLESSRKFYQELFNWTLTEFQTDGNTYILIQHEGKHIGGMIGIPEGNRSQWIGAVSVPDVQDAVQAGLENGGDVLIPSTHITGRGMMALLRDPQGAYLSLIHSSVGDPVLDVINSHEWLWMELWSENPQNSSTYYSSLFSYTTSQNVVDEKPYWLFQSNDYEVAGMLHNPVDNMSTQWIPYIKVTDPDYSVSKARKLGATILLEPRSDIRNGSVAVVADPNGAIFCLQKWPVN